MKFTSPSKDAFFGEVRIYHKEGDKRDLLLPATALSNYTTDNQMMLWAEGEYASIQDRRLTKKTASQLSTYDLVGITDDAEAFIKHNGYFTFKESKNHKKNDFAFLVTQPNKRALIMAGDRNNYWKGESIYSDHKNWGYFILDKEIYDNNEVGNEKKEIGFVSYTSPLLNDPTDLAKYKNEVATFAYEDMINKDWDERFRNGETDGYIDMKINGSRGLPAIITEMSSAEVGGEAQLNWIYSATN
jgi:hypothetical protein